VSNKKILLIGSTGQVGWEINKFLKSLYHVISPSRSEPYSLDLQNPISIKKAIEETSPDLIINAAAYTEVDNAEKNIEQAYKINTESVGYIAELAFKYDIPLIHFSTDYVFDGKEKTVKSEIKATNPLSIYGKSKLDGENLILKSNCNHVILRTSWVFSSRRNNFLKTISEMLDKKDSLSIISDQVSTPTSAMFLAKITQEIVFMIFNKNFSYGIYNCVPNGHASWYEFAVFILEWRKKNNIKTRMKHSDIIPIMSSEYTTLANRPLDSRLCNTKLRKMVDIKIENWTNYAVEVLSELHGN
jgi:dTDP-4-dehydrorhamnose reductase